MKKPLKLSIIRSAILLMLLSLPFLGSDCEDVINQINTTQSIVGNWKLIFNEGSLHDICPGETVNFPSTSGGVATLQCPNQSPISRNYSVSGTTLTYTASGVQYEISFTQANELVLSGLNVNRILYYQQLSADDKISTSNVVMETEYINSSDNSK
ncbi:MAG: hypothetical protein L0Y79_09325 [Chlorobi bacterium]|nr:hypothetical protein [Chlorobiota bacterium]MCI0714718.1 hypothetical protein [Chlorobiota bacterium]